jgi:hypothetical protein
MKATRHSLKKRERNGNIMEGVNLFKVHCMHVWNYPNEIPCIINVCKFKNKIKRKNNRGCEFI